MIKKVVGLRLVECSESQSEVENADRPISIDELIGLLQQVKSENKDFGWSTRIEVGKNRFVVGVRTVGKGTEQIGITNGVVLICEHFTRNYE